MKMTPINSTLTLRNLTAADSGAVERLAQLDGRAAPTGSLLGAEVEGRLLAARSVETGEVVADPFSRTEELRALLDLRTTQLRERGPKVIGRTARAEAGASTSRIGQLVGLHPRAS
jgi:hypothetical protein